MSMDAITKSIEELFNTNGVEACILYRIDGSPIMVKTPKRDDKIIKVMSWMEKQIKYVLKEIKEKNLENLKFSLENKKVFFYPSSRSTVIAAVINKEAHQKLVSLEINNAKEKIRKNII